MPHYLKVKIRSIYGDEENEYQLDSLKDWACIDLSDENGKTIAYMEVYGKNE